MGNFLRTKDLSKIGYTNDQARSLAINILSKHFKHHSKAEQTQLLIEIRQEPEKFLDDEITGKIAGVFAQRPDKKETNNFALLNHPVPVKVYGGKEIESAAKKQMDLAACLPVSIGGALMPDAHMGYGLPIGAVLATDNAVIPFGVGMDIGCGMKLSVIDANENYLRRYDFHLKQALKNNTHFGMNGGLDFRQEHAVLDDPMFRSVPLLKQVHHKAVRQLGSSGSGNHFVEFGEIELYEGNSYGLAPKKYLALLSHSGSRGLGACIAQHYTDVAMASCKLPRQAQHLAWLDLDTESGQEYWMSMNLAGEYASACHEKIHHNLLKDLGLETVFSIANHHNFAWKEKFIDGKEVIVHRKGATPAHEGEAGIIPGSMCSPAYLVKGRGEVKSLNSASHGAGRIMSRQKAKENMTVSAMKKILSKAGVSLIGGSVEENPTAYKDIEKVIGLQKELVEIEGRFLPGIVRMNKD